MIFRCMVLIKGVNRVRIIQKLYLTSCDFYAGSKNKIKEKREGNFINTLFLYIVYLFHYFGLFLMINKK